MNIVRSGFSHDSDDAATGPAELRVVTVPLDFELLNRVKGRINENCTARSHVNVVGAIHQKQVGIRSAAADRDVCAAVEPFFVVAEASISRYAGNQSKQLRKASAVER